MADLADATSACNLVAIDIGRYGNAVLIETASGKRHRFKMANTAADFGRLLSFLGSLPGSCRVGLEPTGDYHRPIAHRLLHAGFEVVSVNSVALARYREAIFNSWDKNDPKDGGTDMNTLTENQIAESREIFDLCDLNGDGFIDHEEFHVLLKVLDGDVSRAESLLDFEVADTAGDGYIEFKEFVRWWTN